MAGVQALVAPQIQGALLAIVPFVLAQARPQNAYAATPELQLLVENLLLFKIKELSFLMHHEGILDAEYCSCGVG